MHSPIAEQEICVTCGFCCDGTLFYNAVLQAGEKGNLPQKMEEAYVKTEKEEFFQLPCSYFDGKCTIYDKKKAHICSAFRCKLLKDFAKDQLSQKDALKIVENVLTLRLEILSLSQSVFDLKKDIPFRQLLDKIGKLEEEQEKTGIQVPGFNILKAKSFILESLLIKHFKSQEAFDKMIVDTEEKN